MYKLHSHRPRCSHLCTVSKTRDYSSSCPSFDAPHFHCRRFDLPSTHTRQANAAKPHERRGSSDREEKEAVEAKTAAAEEKNAGNPASPPPATETAGGGGGGEYLGYAGADPVTGQLVRSGELVKASPAEVADYLKHYNELDDGDENKDKDRTTAGARGGGDGGGRAAVNEAFGSGAEAGEPRGNKNSEGRASDSAPVASAGAGPYRHKQNGMPAAG